MRSIRKGSQGWVGRPGRGGESKNWWTGVRNGKVLKAERFARKPIGVFVERWKIYKEQSERLGGIVQFIWRMSFKLELTAEQNQWYSFTSAHLKKQWSEYIIVQNELDWGHELIFEAMKFFADK